MNKFSYLARDRAGTLTRGTQSAESPERLQSLLESTGLSLVSFSSERKLDFGLPTREPKQPWLSSLSWWRPSGRAVELALKQLAMMLRSGLDLRAALQTVLEQTTSLPLARAIRSIHVRVEQGQTLQAAMASTRAFPDICVQLVGVGEATGNLSHVLERAAEHLESRRTSINSVRVALAYPILVATAAVSIAIYLVVFVIPELQRMLVAMGRRLPRMTQSLLDLSVWLQVHGATCLASFFIACGVLIACTFWPPTRLVIDGCLLRLPMIGSILRMSGTATLASSLAVMIRSGTRLVDALAIAQRLQANQVLAGRVERSRGDVVRGQSLSRELGKQPGYVPMLASMLKVAEQTGQLEQSLEEVAAYCDAELKGKIKRLSLLIEPTIIVLAGVIVGYVYMAFFMALMSAGGNIR